MPTLAILKLDQIGDYVVFRNFIKEVKNSKKYAGYKIVLVGNIVYKDFAKELDGEFIDKFIGVNKRSYRKYALYRSFIANEINAQKIDVVISPTYSRDAQWVENIVKSIKAKEKIGSSGDATNITLGQKQEADKRYSQLIQQADKPMFEFERYKEFFEKLLNKKYSVKTPVIEIEDVEKTRLVGFFPGAGSKYRQWSTQNFAKLADFIKENSDYKICLLGGPKDRKLAKAIMKNSSADFIDMTGKLKLSKLPKYCKKLQFVVTNDTAGLHISAAVGTKTICISNGNTYPRFVEYPNKDMVKVVYSDDVEKNLSSAKYVKDNLLYGSNFDINDVALEKVLAVVKELLPKKVAPKAPVKKAPASKTAAKATAKKVVAKKTTKTAATTKKATPAKKAATKTTAKKVVKKATTTKPAAKKTTTKATATKAPAKKASTTKKTTKKGA